MTNLANKTIIITGASRGIGRAIAIRCARAGANIVIAAKSDKPHPKLAGTIHTVAEEVDAAGGNPLPIALDVRDDRAIKKMMATVAERFGGIDALVNNAGAISLTTVEATKPARYDLMQDINARAVYACSHAAIPYLRESENPHILSLSPPVSLDAKWLKDFAPYSISKYGMSLLSRGMAEELREDRIGVNCLWPRTIIATAAIEFALGGRDKFKNCRKPDIMADAAHDILVSDSGELTGQWLIDEEFLRSRGTTDFSGYAFDPAYADRLDADLFLEPLAGQS